LLRVVVACLLACLLASNHVWNSNAKNREKRVEDVLYRSKQHCCACYLINSDRMQQQQHLVCCEVIYVVHSNALCYVTDFNVSSLLEMEAKKFYTQLNIWEAVDRFKSILGLFLYINLSQLALFQIQ